MAGARNIRAGGAYVELLTKDGALRKGLDNAAKTLKSWGNGISALGAQFLKIGTAAMAPLVATSKVFSSMGDELAKSSTRTGVAVEELSALAYAASQSGTNLEGLESGLRKMSVLVVDAAKGSEDAANTLRQLGFTWQMLAGLKPEDKFKAIADSIAQIQDPTLRAAMAMKVFGKNGTELLPLMSDGAKGIAALEAEARRLGLTWSTKDAKAAEEFNDRLDDLWKVTKRATAVIGGSLVPVLREAVVWITQNVVKMSKWIDTHREVVVTALKVTAGVLATGAALLVLGKSLVIVGAVTSAVSSGLGAIASAAAIAGKVLSVVLFSSIGLVTAGLAGLGLYLIYNSEVGQKALGALAGYFGELYDTATEALGGIVDALKAGDFALAAQVLWAGLKLAWAQGIEPLENAWAAFKMFFQRTATDAFFGVLEIWTEVGKTLGDAWREVMFTAQYAFMEFAAGIKTVWEGTQSYLSDKFLELFNLFGKLSDQELADAKAMGQQETLANQKGIQDSRDAQRTALVDKLRKDRADSEAKYARTIEDLATANNQAIDSIKSEAQSRKDAAQKELEAAKKNLDDATGKAKDERAKKEREAPNFPAPPKLPDPNAIAQSLDDVSKRIAPRGLTATFDVQSLQSGLQKEQLEALKKIEKNTSGLRGGGGLPVI